VQWDIPCLRISSTVFSVTSLAAKMYESFLPGDVVRVKLNAGISVSCAETVGIVLEARFFDVDTTFPKSSYKVMYDNSCTR